MRTIVVGGGYFGLNYVRELSHHLLGVVEPNKERAEFIAQKFNIKVWPELPTYVDYDAAIIVSPPDTHIKLAKQVLEAGHYCLIEKPLGLSVEECLQLNKYRKKVMSGLIYLYHPEVEFLKQQVWTYPINHIYTRRTNSGPVRNEIDALWDLAPHDIAILNYITGQTPISISCYKEKDWAILNLEYLGFPTCTYVSWLGGPKTRLVEIVLQPDEGETNDEDRIIFDDMKSALEVSPLRRMLDDFLTGDWNSKSSFEAGLEVVSVLEKASQS